MRLDKFCSRRSNLKVRLCGRSLSQADSRLSYGNINGRFSHWVAVLDNLSLQQLKRDNLINHYVLLTYSNRLENVKSHHNIWRGVCSLQHQFMVSVAGFMCYSIHNTLVLTVKTLKR